MINRGDIINELKKYTQFLDETVIPVHGSDLTRRWCYRWDENSFLASKSVVCLEKDEMIIYDYSAIIDLKLTLDNYKSLMNNIDVKMWKVGENLNSISKMKEILENNIKACLRAEQLERKIERFKKIDEEL